MKHNVLFLSVILLISACTGHDSPQAVAESFLEAYLDCRFDEAAKMASPEVGTMLHWRASQLTQAELELLNEHPVADVTVEDAEEADGEWVVTLRAIDALLMDSIGQPAHVGDARYRVVLVRAEGKRWRVSSLQAD